MNPDWHSFLTRHGATMDAGVVQHFGDPAAELDAAAQRHRAVRPGPVRHAARVRRGSAIVPAEPAEQRHTRSQQHPAQLSSLNTAKGRMLATMLIWREGDDYLLQLPRVLCEPIRKKLSHVCAARQGQDQRCQRRDHFAGTVRCEQRRRSCARNSANCRKLPLGVIGTVHKAARSKSATRAFRSTPLRHTLPRCGRYSASTRSRSAASCWDWLNIRSGIPVILPQTQEQFVAQMVNLELIGGVNFNKGCYPGQEIVARMQYLGKLKRRMYLAHLDRIWTAAMRRKRATSCSAPTWKARPAA